MENHLDIYILREHRECVNLLKAFVQREQLDRDIELKVGIKEIQGHCNEATPKTDKPNIYF